MAAKGLTYIGSLGTLGFVKRLRTVTASVTGASMATVAVTVVSTVTVTGAAVGDHVSVQANTAQPLTLSFTGVVSAADTVKILANNPTAAPINTNTSTWNVVVEKDM